MASRKGGFRRSGTYPDTASEHELKSGPPGLVSPHPLSQRGDWMTVDEEGRREGEEFGEGPIMAADRAPYPYLLGSTDPTSRMSVRLSANGRTVMPFKQNVTLPYVELLTISSPASANLIAGKVFSMTSAYDPNYTDVGHQPLGYDQWGALYREYYVRRVEWEVTFSSATTTHTLLGNVMAHPSLTLAGSQADTYFEQPGGKSGLLRYGDAGPPLTLSGSVSIADWFGIKPAGLGLLDGIRAEVTASPAEAVGLHVGVGTLATHASASVYAVVKLRYHITFLKPVQLVGS